jgi:hypothetical protein
MGIGDEAGMKTLQQFQRMLPEMLGAQNVATLVDATVEEVASRAERLGRELLAETRQHLARTLDHEVSNLVGQTRQEADKLVETILAEVDKRLEQRIGEIEARAERLSKVILEQARNNLASVLDREVTRLVQQARHEAGTLVDHSLTRVESTATTLVGQLSAAMSRQQTEVRINADAIIERAGTQVEPLSRRLLWVGIFIGLANFAGIVVGSLVAK